MNRASLGKSSAGVMKCNISRCDPFNKIKDCDMSWYQGQNFGAVLD